METWFILAILSLFFSGTFVFVQKYGVENSLDIRIFTRWLQWGQLISALIMWGVLGFSTDDFVLISLLSIATGVIYLFVHLSRARSLENIDTTIFFPINKFLGPGIVAFVGVTVLGDSLGGWEYLGVALGLLVPLLLLDRFESSRQKNLKRGLQWLVIGTLISACGIFVSRAGALSAGDIWYFVFLQAVVGVALLYVRRRGEDAPDDVQLEKKVILFGLLGGVVNAMSIYCILKAFETGLVSVIYTINSFYILIPIILSVIIYKEHMNLRKALAIGLSIVAVIFFQI